MSGFDFSDPSRRLGSTREQGAAFNAGAERNSTEVGETGKKGARKLSERGNRPTFRVGIVNNKYLDDDEDDLGIFSDEKIWNNDLSFEGTSTNTQASEDNSFHFNYGTLGKPMLKKRKAQKGPELVKVRTLPDYFQSIFDFEEFNRMQSEAFDKLYGSDRNCVISSPTGSGKTVLFELAILNELKNSGDPSNIKVLYMAPTKSLCNEKYKEWGSSFLNLSVGMLTSDTSQLEADKVKSSNIIITTPEKWDLLTRKWDDYKRLFELIRLVMVDEIHILRDQRGATLEVVLTRMNTMCRDMRIIAVSATIPNVYDISDWLKCTTDMKPATTLVFDDSYRQVMLEKHVYGYPAGSKNDFQLDSIYNSKLIDIINKHSAQKPVLVFCSTRNSSISTAKYLSQNWHTVLGLSSRSQAILTQDRQLSDCSRLGVAFHHAGLSLEDRNVIEQGFLSGKIKILCSTSTLSIGVNLPAYLVVIKGTKMWQANESQEYSELDILQMIGRAGRPKFEKKGCAVIMTGIEYKGRYEMLVNGTEQLESSLHLNLIEHLVAEITLDTIKNPTDAVQWLKNTFLYVRLQKNPKAYKEISPHIQQWTELERSLVKYCEKLLKMLSEHQIITFNEDGSCCSSPFGKAMTRHYILFETIKNFIQAPPSLSLNGVLKLFCQAEEFSQIRIKHNEKRLYREINSSPLIRFPLLDNKNSSQFIDTRPQKISLLIQYELSGLEFPTYTGAIKHHQSLIQERMFVFRHCHRILKCMIDCFIEKGDGLSLKNTLFLLRSVNAKGWEDSPMVLRQLNNIGLVSVRKFVQRKVNTLQDLESISDIQIENILNLKIGTGAKLRKDLEMLPKLSIVYSIDKYTFSEGKVNVTFNIEIKAKFKTSVWHGSSLHLVALTIKNSRSLLDFRRISLQKLTSPKNYRIFIEILSIEDSVEFFLSCENVAGVNAEVRFMANDLPKECRQQFLGTSAPIVKLEPHQAAPTPTLDLSDDDIIHFVENSEDEKTTKIQRRQFENGNYECNHTCKNKSACRHLCCKEGIPASMIKDHKHTRGSKSLHEKTKSANVYKEEPEAMSMPQPIRTELQTEENHLSLSMSSPIETTYESELTREAPQSILKLASKYNITDVNPPSETLDTLRGNDNEGLITECSAPQPPAVVDLIEEETPKDMATEVTVKLDPSDHSDDVYDSDDQQILAFLGSDIELAH